ncbi:MAG: RNA polymerase sigma factor [Polyangiales bacterium]
MSEPPEQQALAALEPAVRGLVAVVLGARPQTADVEDCTSEVFRRVLEHRDKLHAGAPLRPWVLGIARNVALDFRRTRARTLKRSELRTADDDAPPALDRVSDDGPAPDDRADLAERTRRMQCALAGLPDAQRTALLLHAEGLGYQEIAGRLDVPLGTVATWISRGRQGLAHALKDLSPGEEARVR